MAAEERTKSKASKAQKTERGRFANLITEWGKLSYEDKLKWHEVAKYDYIKKSSKGKKIIDGHSMFMSYNGFLQVIGEPINLKVPASNESVGLIAKKIEIKNDGKDSYFRFYFKEQINENTKVILYATKGLNLSTPRFNERELRTIGVIDEKFMSGDSVLAQYLRQYKSLPEKGKVIGFKMTPINKYSGKKGLSFIFATAVK